LLEPNPILIGVNRNALTLTLPFVPEGGVLRIRVRAAAVMEHDDAPPCCGSASAGRTGRAASPIR
jgi:hypothetical protein